jgi:hypothetical protein
MSTDHGTPQIGRQRQSYRRPALRVYGSMSALTAGGSGSANENSGAAQNQRRP